MITVGQAAWPGMVHALFASTVNAGPESIGTSPSVSRAHHGARDGHGTARRRGLLSAAATPSMKGNDMTATDPETAGTLPPMAITGPCRSHDLRKVSPSRACIESLQ